MNSYPHLGKNIFNIDLFEISNWTVVHSLNQQNLGNLQNHTLFYHFTSVPSLGKKTPETLRDMAVDRQKNCSLQTRAIIQCFFHQYV